ncbi:MAG: L,D-transpeptidase family protein [Lentisphaerae bacterium]|nr:L,D-transpeptidase family protein [Lentisphaerota bacterium]
MADLPLQDIDGNVRYPKRRPWLVLFVVVAVGAFLFWRQMRTPHVAPDAPSPGSGAPSAGSPVTAEPAAVISAGAIPPTQATSASPAVVPATAPPAAGPNLSRLLQQARDAEALEAQDPGALAEARRHYLDVLKLGVNPTMRKDVEERLGRINTSLALSPLPLPDAKVDYVVKNGDSIERIAKRLGTTTRLIERSNQVANPNRIKVGDHFRILTGKFAIAVNKTTKDLLVTLNGEFFKRYGVGTGKFGKTPTGEFEIYDKIPEPTWWRPDGKEVPFGNPENILGTRWMAIRAVTNAPDVRGYGIHGTWDDASIGKAESAGCIRMHNPEVEELFDIVPVGTRVIITE